MNEKHRGILKMYRNNSIKCFEFIVILWRQTEKDQKLKCPSYLIWIRLLALKRLILLNTLELKEKKVKRIYLLFLFCFWIFRELVNHIWPKTTLNIRMDWDKWYIIYTYTLYTHSISWVNCSFDILKMSHCKICMCLAIII